MSLLDLTLCNRLRLVIVIAFVFMSSIFIDSGLRRPTLLLAGQRGTAYEWGHYSIMQMGCGPNGVLAYTCDHLYTYKPTPFHPSSFSPTFTFSSTSLFHSCHLTRNRQSTRSIIWFILWSRSCSYHRTKENFQRNIFNYPLNSKSFRNHRYLPFHLKIIYNQPTVKKTFTQ